METLSSSNLWATPVQENKGQSWSTQPSCSIPMSQEDILNLHQQNATPGFKYCLTLVPRETDSLEEVLKNQMLTKNANKKDSSAHPPKGQKILMHGAIITYSDYWTQIAEKALAGKKHKEAEQKEEKEAKKNKNLKERPNKSTGKEFREMLRMMIKDNIEEDVIDMSTDEEVAKNENVVKENKTETKVVCSGLYNEKRNESENSLLTFSIAELGDFNVGKYLAVYWPKPKAYHWGKLLKVFSADADSYTTEVEIQFLKKVQNSTDSSQVKWDWPATEDKGIVDAKLFFADPCTLNTTDSSHAKSTITFMLEAEVMAKFHEICNHGVLH